MLHLLNATLNVWFILFTLSGLTHRLVLEIRGHPHWVSYSA